MRIDVSRAGGRILDTKFLERRDRNATIGVMYRCVIYGPAQRFRRALVHFFTQAPVAAKSGKKVAGLQGERFGKCRVGFVTAGNIFCRADRCPDSFISSCAAQYAQPRNFCGRLPTRRNLLADKDLCVRLRGELRARKLKKLRNRAGRCCPAAFEVRTC